MFVELATNDTYSLADIEQKGSCQQIGNRYKWGFSFLLLFSFVVTFFAWTIAVYGLYLNTYIYSHLDTVDRHMGIERAVADLAQSADGQVYLPEWRMYSNAQLESMTKNFRISYSDLVDGTPTSARATTVQTRWWWPFSQQATTHHTIH